MKEKILELRAQGKTYLEIEKELGCRRSTISYHCGDGQKLKSKERNKIFRNKNIKHILLRKISIYTKRRVVDFRYSEKKNRRTRDLVLEKGFDYEKALDIISNTTKCYLTGRDIDVTKPNSYHLDHIIPLSREGGTSQLKNMGIACRSANLAKSDMLIDEFIELCRDVLVNFGYRVERG